MFVWKLLERVVHTSHFCISTDEIILENQSLCRSSHAQVEEESWMSFQLSLFCWETNTSAPSAQSYFGSLCTGSVFQAASQATTHLQNPFQCLSHLMLWMVCFGCHGEVTGFTAEPNVWMCSCDGIVLLTVCFFPQTLRGGLWSSWVLLLRPFLLSCIRLHLAACWLLTRDPPAAWEPARPLCPFGRLFWLLFSTPRFSWAFWIRAEPPAVWAPAWSHGLPGGGAACCFWAVGALGRNASGLLWLLPLEVFTRFCLRSFFQTRSQNSSTLFSSGWSRRDRKSRYHTLCLGEWPEPPPAPGSPGRMSASLWVGMTWRLRRSRGWMKPCSMAWQWYTPASDWVKLRISSPWSVRRTRSSNLIWNKRKINQLEKKINP